jgi:hypothetical protein
VVKKRSLGVTVSMLARVTKTSIHPFQIMGSIGSILCSALTSEHLPRYCDLIVHYRFMQFIICGHLSEYCTE